MKAPATITPLKMLMPVVANGNVDECISIQKKLTGVHDEIQSDIPPSRERALMLTKLEEASHWLAACSST